MGFRSGCELFSTARSARSPLPSILSASRIGNAFRICSRFRASRMKFCAWRGVIAKFRSSHGSHSPRGT